MQKNQIFNKHVLLNHTYDYVGTLYKLIISANSGEILHVLVESQQFGQMFILPFDKIINIAEEYLIIESRQALADFESFKGIDNGKFLIVDEETVKHLKIEGVIERQIASKSEVPKQSSYYTIMQYEKPETKREPVGVASGMAKSAMYDTQTTQFHGDEGPLLTEPHPHDEYAKSETQRIWDDEPMMESRGYPPIEFTRSGGNPEEARHFASESMPVSSRQFLHPQNIFQREEKLRLAKEAINNSQESQTKEYVSKSNDLDKLKADIGREKETLQKLNVQHQIVSRELDQIRIELESVEHEKEEGFRSISNGKAEIKELMLQKKSLFKEIDIARAELSRVHEEVSEQSDKLVQLHKEMEAAEQSKADLDYSLQITQKEVEAAEQSKANLEHTLQVTQQEVETAEQSKASLEHTLQITQQEIEAAEQSKANLDYSLQMTQQEIEAAEQNKANLEYTLQITQKEIEAAEQSKANLEYTLQIAQEEYNDTAELFMLQEKRLRQISLHQVEHQNATVGINNAGTSMAWGNPAAGNDPHGVGIGGVSEAMPTTPGASGLSENWSQTIGAGDAHDLMVPTYPGSPGENSGFSQTNWPGEAQEPMAAAYPGGVSENTGFGQAFETGVTHEPSPVMYQGSSTPNLQIGEASVPGATGPMHGSSAETAGLGTPATYGNPVAPMHPEPVSYPGPVEQSSPQVSEQKSEADLIQNYIDKQREGLIGKTLSRSVSDRNGNVLLNAGTVITEQLFDEVSARNKDAVVELAMFAE